MDGAEIVRFGGAVDLVTFDKREISSQKVESRDQKKTNFARLRLAKFSILQFWCIKFVVLANTYIHRYIHKTLLK